MLLVNAILEDLQNRRGLRQSWDEIDTDTRKEIQAQWTALAIRWFAPLRDVPP